MSLGAWFGWVRVARYSTKSAFQNRLRSRSPGRVPALRSTRTRGLPKANTNLLFPLTAAPLILLFIHPPREHRRIWAMVGARMVGQG